MIILSVASIGSFIALIFLGLIASFLLGSIIPLDLDRWKEFDTEQLYYQLYPHIMEDFMGKDDCQAVHTEGNMQAVVSGATGIVIHSGVRGGSDNLASIKEQEYRVRLENGEMRISSAQETGEFTG